MLTINFNHSAKNLSNSLGMTKDELIYAKLALMFSSLSPKILATFAYINDKEKIKEILTNEDGEEENEMIKALKKLALEVKLTPVRMLSEYVRDANGDFDKFYNDIKVKVLDNPDNADLHKMFNTDED